MAEESKTYVFDTAAKGSGGIDPNALLAMMNNNGGNGGWGNASWLWIVFLFFLYGWRGNGMFGGAGGGDASGQAARNFDTDLLMQAIGGNGTAISQLASTLNCDTNAVQGALNALQGAVQNVGSQVGLSGQQVINAIQGGNQAIAAQMAQCCCDNKLLVTTQGYENQIATLNQTNQLGSRIDGGTAAITGAIAQQTTLINDRFCQLEMREMQGKIDALTAANNALQNSISNSQQTAAIQGFVAQTIAPLQNDINAIRASQPQTVSVPWPQLAAVPASYAGALYGGAYGFGSIWS